MTKNHQNILSTINTRSEGKKERIFNLLEDVCITNLIENEKKKEIPIVEKQKKSSEKQFSCFSNNDQKNSENKKNLEFEPTDLLFECLYRGGEELLPSFEDLLSSKIVENKKKEVLVDCSGSISSYDIERDIENMKHSKDEIISIFTGAREFQAIPAVNMEFLNAKEKKKPKYGWVNYKNQTKIK